jgi:hypothetical protein
LPDIIRVQSVCSLWHSIRPTSQCPLYCHTVLRNIHSVVCVTVGRSIVPSKRVPHTGRSVASYFNFQNNPLHKSLSSSCLSLLLRPRLPSIFSSVKHHIIILLIIKPYIWSISFVHLIFFLLKFIQYLPTSSSLSFLCLFFNKSSYYCYFINNKTL